MDLAVLTKNLEQKGYQVRCFPTGGEAALYLDAHIRDKTVGFGDSQTLLTLELGQRLTQHNQVYDPQSCVSNETFLAVARQALLTQVFVTSVNAVSQTGELVNLDGTGNRVAGSLFGHEKVYFVVGVNKVVPTLQDAIERTRHVAAPANARRLGLQTPCAQEGLRCYDCKSPQRICNGLVVHLNKMEDMDMEVIFIEQDLGL